MKTSNECIIKVEMRLAEKAERAEGIKDLVRGILIEREPKVDASLIEGGFKQHRKYKTLSA